MLGAHAADWEAAGGAAGQESGDCISLKLIRTNCFRSNPGEIKHTLITTGDGKAMIDIVAGFSSAVEVRHFDDGVGDVQMSPSDSPPPFMPAAAAGAEPPHPAVRVHLERQNHISRQDTVQSVPQAQRDRTADEDGQFQVGRR